MIRINLLEEGEKAKRPKKGKAVGEPLVSKPLVISQYIIIATIVLALIPLFIGYKKFMKVREVVNNVEVERSKKKSNEKQVADLKKKSAAVKEVLDTLRNQAEVVTKLTPGESDIYWSEKLDYLSDLIPENIYILNLKITESVREVETKESIEARQAWEKNKKSGPPPPKQTRPLIEQRLILTCIAQAEERENRIRLMTSFQDAMKNHQTIRHGKVRRFIDNFQDSVIISGIKTVDSYGVECGQFTITLITKQT